MAAPTVTSIFRRFCSSCNTIISYSSKRSYIRACKESRVCKGCMLSSRERIEKMRVTKKGKRLTEETKLAISNSLKGKKRRPNKHPFSELTLSKMSIAHGGNGKLKNYRNFHFRQGQLTYWANKAKKKVPYCEFCFSEDNLEAHHILSKSKFPQYALNFWNFRVLCQPCHKICHKQGGF